MMVSFVMVAMGNTSKLFFYGPILYFSAKSLPAPEPSVPSGDDTIPPEDGIPGLPEDTLAVANDFFAYLDAEQVPEYAQLYFQILVAPSSGGMVSSPDGTEGSGAGRDASVRPRARPSIAAAWDRSRGFWGAKWLCRDGLLVPAAPITRAEICKALVVMRSF